MYRGRPPPRGGYPPPFEGRGPPPPRNYPTPDYRDDRYRPRHPYHPDYHDRAHPDPYRRSPPRRRYPSPGSGSHRGGEYWAGGPPREVSQPGSKYGFISEHVYFFTNEPWWVNVAVSSQCILGKVRCPINPDTLFISICTPDSIQKPVNLAQC